MVLNQEISRFLSFSGFQNEAVSIETVGSHILKLTPKHLKSSMTLGFLALVHGNETIGLPILNNLLQSLVTGEIQIDYQVYFGLGNITAAHKDVRFVEEDLNRCFGLLNSNTLESARAREVETLMLNHCDYIIDLHQTQRAALKPFFIFQYSSPRCLTILEKMNPGIPTVLQTDPIGENTGLSTDEYIRARGGFGTALELGEKGDFQHQALGLEICKNAMIVLEPLHLTSHHLQNEALKLPLFQLSGKMKALGSSDQLDLSWKNFGEFKAGQEMGTRGSGVIQAPEDGFLLFPRFSNVKAGDALFHYCTPIKALELNQKAPAEYV